jgi:hypothetical protein
MKSFADKLREEILKSQDRRSALSRQKLAYVTATFGLGAISAEKFSTSGLLFLAPVIALSFDLYIAGEDFGIKRAGGFLGREGSSASGEEKEWEKRVKKHYDPFSKFANPFVSVIVLISAAVLLWGKYQGHFLYLPWLLINAILICLLWASSHTINKKVRDFEKPFEETKSQSSPKDTKGPNP